jgi:hypothetical protein
MTTVGTFSGTPKTEWLNQPADDARDMKLLEEFIYSDSKGKRWDAPVGSIINGASIPQWLWDTIGSPYTGCYRNASIVHDIACVRATTKAERLLADKMFWEACVAGGCTEPQANDLYAGVRIGAWWSPPSARGMRTLMSPREIKREATDSKKVYTAVRKKLGGDMATATLSEIDKVVDAEMSKASTRSMTAASAPRKKAATRTAKGGKVAKKKTKKRS